MWHFRVCETVREAGEIWQQAGVLEENGTNLWPDWQIESGFGGRFESGSGGWHRLAYRFFGERDEIRRKRIAWVETGAGESAAPLTKVLQERDSSCRIGWNGTRSRVDSWPVAPPSPGS